MKGKETPASLPHPSKVSHHPSALAMSSKCHELPESGEAVRRCPGLGKACSVLLPVLGTDMAPSVSTADLYLGPAPPFHVSISPLLYGLP